MLVERCRHTDDQSVRLARPREVIRYRQSPANACGDALSSNVLDVAPSVPQLSDLVRVDVETEHAKACLHETQSEWQADISEPDDSDDRFPIPDAVKQRLLHL